MITLRGRRLPERGVHAQPGGPQPPERDHFAAGEREPIISAA